MGRPNRRLDVDDDKNLGKDGLSENAIKKKMNTIVADSKWRPARKGLMRSKRWYRRIDKL